MERRKFLTAAAAAVPAIAVAVTAPAIAASVEVCERRQYFYDPRTNGKPSDPYDSVVFTVLTGEYVRAEFLVDYPHATALNINGQIIDKRDGVRAGDVLYASLDYLGICDPEFIQVDGTNTHYYGGGAWTD